MTELTQEHPSKSESFSRFFFINPVGELSYVPSITDAIKAAQDGGYLWLDYCDPTKDDLEPLISLFNIHPLSIEDCLNEEQLPKLDLFPNYSFMVFNIFFNIHIEFFSKIHALGIFFPNKSKHVFHIELFNNIIANIKGCFYINIIIWIGGYFFWDMPE